MLLFVAVLGMGTAAPVLAAQAPVPFSMPSRGTPPAAPEPPPELPAEAMGLKPLTFEVGGRPAPPGGPPAAAQRVTQTVDRVHVQVSPTREWLYTRNPVDPRRVSGVMIDHAARVLVDFEESDLRNAFGIRGWLDVVTLPAALPRSAAAVRDSVDDSLLQPPALRFPAYREIGYADWLERHGGR